LQKSEENISVSGVTVVAPEISHHHHRHADQSHTNDNAKYQFKYERLKHLVKETIFVSDQHFCSFS